MHHIAFLIFDGIELLDMSGPQTTFYEANGLLSPEDAYTLSLVGFDTAVVTTEAGTRLLPDYSLKTCAPIDTFVIPGGQGARLLQLTELQQQQLNQTLDRAKRVVSICTGIFLVERYASGRYRSATTHWNFISALKVLSPELSVDDNRLYIEDGKYWSSAGVTAGIDLSLQLVAKDHSPQLAADVARFLVVYLQRSGGQQQYSGMLQLQQPATPVLSKLVKWISEHLQQSLTTGVLADQACVSERSLYRLFKEGYDCTPMQYVTAVRLEHARQLLTGSKQSVKAIGLACGYPSYDSFRRAFERETSINPQAYREHFSQ